jgi:hypothetical protein
VRLHCTSDEFFECLLRKLGWQLAPVVMKREVTLLRDPVADAVRFCATMPGTAVPSSSFATIRCTSAGAGAGGGALVDFTRDATAMNDICPTFRGIAASDEARFEARGFFARERGEPSGGAVELVLPRFAERATYSLTWAVPAAVVAASRENGAAGVPAAAAAADVAAQSAWAVKAVAAEAAVLPSFAPGRGATRVAAVKTKSGLDMTGWFAVTPLKHCPHVEAACRFAEGTVYDVDRPCLECGNVGENMMCFSCGEVHCGRHVRGHAVAHSEQHPTHHIVCCMKDLSVWCYACDSYIEPDNRFVAAQHRLLYRAKFAGDETPQVMDDAALGGGASAPAPAPAVSSGGGAAGAAIAAAASAAAAAVAVAPPPPADDDDRVAEALAALGIPNSAAGASRNGGSSGSSGSGGGFAVQPQADCPHTARTRLTEGAVFDVQQPCATCGNVGENMLCLECNAVHCGRHVRGHALNHHEQTGHAMVLAFADLSCWCYACDAYINARNRHVAPVAKLLYMSKFGEQW